MQVGHVDEKIMFNTMSFPSKLADYGALVELGKGSTGIVYKVTVGGTDYALKTIKPSHLADDRHTKNLNREVVIGQLAARDSALAEIIPPIYHAFKENGSFYLVMKLIKGVELFEFLSDHCDEAKDIVLISIVKMLLDLVRKLHSHKIVHLDIKPENIIYDPAIGNLMLIDFGLSCVQGIDGSDCFFACKGTPEYLSPELILHKFPAHMSQHLLFGAANDVWAASVCAYEILQRFQRGFDTKHPAASVDNTRNHPMFNATGSEALDELAKMIRTAVLSNPANFSKRPNAEQLYQQYHSLANTLLYARLPLKKRKVRRNDSPNPRASAKHTKNSAVKTGTGLQRTAKTTVKTTATAKGGQSKFKLKLMIPGKNTGIAEIPMKKRKDDLEKKRRRSSSSDHKR